MGGESKPVADDFHTSPERHPVQASLLLSIQVIQNYYW